MNQLLLTTQILLCILQEWEAFVSLVDPYHLYVFHTFISVQLTFCGSVANTGYIPKKQE